MSAAVTTPAHGMAERSKQRNAPGTGWRVRYAHAVLSYIGGPTAKEPGVNKSKRIIALAVLAALGVFGGASAAVTGAGAPAAHHVFVRQI